MLPVPAHDTCPSPNANQARGGYLNLKMGVLFRWGLRFMRREETLCRLTCSPA